MGREPTPIKCPRGVTIRQFVHAKVVIIAFVYKGIQCRERTTLPATAAGVKIAENLRGEILRKIDAGTFVYTDYFPNGAKAALFGKPAAKVTVGDLLDNQTAAYRRNSAAVKPSAGMTCYAAP